MRNAHDAVFVATGFNKWGVTAGTASALLLSSLILGGRINWARAFAAWSPGELAGLGTAVRANLEVAFHLAKGWVAPLTRLGRNAPADGGVVTGLPCQLEARCTINVVQHKVSPVCPHLGGIVNWNQADQSWECPLHGSRFAPDGALLEGPATRGLAVTS